MYWAQALAAQNKDMPLQARFAKIAKELAENEHRIVEELLSVQGQPVDIGGYYLPNAEKAEEAMRPSPTFNTIIDAI